MSGSSFWGVGVRLLAQETPPYEGSSSSSSLLLLQVLEGP